MMPGSAAAFFLAATCLPLVAAGLLVVPSLRRGTLAVAPWATLPAVLLAITVEPGTEVRVPGLLLGARLGLDHTGRLFLLFSSLLWLASAHYARGYLASDPRQHRFFVFFLLAMAGNLGAIVAADVVTFYAFFAMMSLASYGLVVHDRTPDALRAGRVYIAFAIVGEVLLFAGIVGIAGLSGAVGFAEMHSVLSRDAAGTGLLVLVFAGLAVKTASVPVHMWLPPAHRAAPAPASAVLSGLMIKAGLLGWLRFLPLGVTAMPVLGTVCLVVGFTSALLGVIVGLLQRDPKSALGYSSISQMGLITVGLGAGLLTPEAWTTLLPAVGLYALHHAGAKSALFLGTGIAVHAGDRHRGLVAAGLLLPALSLAGVPFTSGAAAKVALKDGLGLATGSAVFEWPLSIAAVLTTLLMARYLALVAGAARKDSSPLTARMLMPWLAVVGGVALLVWVLPWNGVQRAAAVAAAPTYLWSTSWPALVGALVAWGCWRTPRIGTLLARAHVPPGDVLVLLEQGIGRLMRRLRPLAERAAMLRSGAPPVPSSRSHWTRRAVAVEARLQAWDAVVMFMLLLASLLGVFLSI